MSRLFLSVLLVFGLTTAASAKDFREKYEDVSLPLLTEYMTRSKLIKLTTKEQLLDYLAVTECEIYKGVKDSQFKQQEIQHAIEQKIAKPVPGDGVLYVKVPTMFFVSEYNFDTQSMTLANESQMKKANVLDLQSGTIPVCDDITSNKLMIPSVYNVRLNIPISFYRIPLKKEIAETVYSRMDRQSYGKRRNVVYGTLYIQVEPVEPIIDEVYSTSRAVVRGQVNVIDLYLDQDRKVLLRQLDFDENF